MLTLVCDNFDAAFLIDQKGGWKKINSECGKSGIIASFTRQKLIFIDK